MTQDKFATLRARGKGYVDTYSDVYAEGDTITIAPHKMGFPAAFAEDSGWQVVSSPFEYSGELEGHPAIWTTITSAWGARASRNTLELRADMDAALNAAGYRAIGGGSLV